MKRIVIATTMESMAIPMLSDQFQPNWNRMPSGTSGRKKVIFGVTKYNKKMNGS